MSDQGNMFDGSQQEPNQQQEPQTNQVPEFLAEYVGEGKKYQTQEDALRSVPDAQAHIDRLEQELKQLREVPPVDPDKLMNDIESKLLEKMQNGATPQAPTADNAHQQPADPAPVIELDDVVNKVKSMLTQEQTEAQLLEQQKSVVQTAISVWGRDAEKNLYSKAAEVGLDAQSIDQLAATSPQAALKLLGLEAPQQKSFSPQGNIKPQASQYGAKPTLPEKPENWGNDAEMVDYIRKMAEYEAAGGKFN